MKKNKLISVLAASLVITAAASLSSCANEEEISKWLFSKEDMTDFIHLEADEKDNADGTITYSTNTGIEIFDEDIQIDDVIVFDIDAVESALYDYDLDYADYHILEEEALDIVDVVNLDDKDGFDITFKESSSNKRSGNNYGMLVCANVTSADKFVLVTKKEENKQTQEDAQVVFEEKYVSRESFWEDGLGFITSLVLNYSMMGSDDPDKGPSSFTKGIFALLATLMESSMEEEIEGIVTKLYEIDRKIDELGRKIDKNFQLLQDETVRVNANVDKANLNVLNISINDFATNQIAPINKFVRNLEDELGTYYKKIVSEPQTIKLAIEKGSDGYSSTPLYEIKDNSKYNFEFVIDDFTNAKAFLKDNNNIVKNGFVASLEKDIENTLNKSINLNSEISKDDYKKFITARISENFLQDYFSKNRDKAQDYRNLVIELAESISGMSGKVSYLETYLNRLQYMYNFQNEIKPLIRSFCANLLKALDANTAIAAQACNYAEINFDELASTYKTTRSNIQKFYKANNEISDTYSFITKTALTGDFYKSYYTPTYTNLGNHPTLTVTFNTYNVGMKDGSVALTQANLSSHNGISDSSHLKISTRWNLLKSISEASSSYDYAHYLNANKVISNDGVAAADFLLSLNKMSSSCYRILTNDRSERDMNSNDGDVVFKCVTKGNNDCDYFRIGTVYRYQGSRDAKYWAGRTFEGKFINGTSGTALGTQKICSWARYHEDHWYWRTDEFFSFTSDDPNNYYFLVENVQ